MRRTAMLMVFVLAGCGQPPAQAIDGDAEAGRRLVARVDCGVCHTIPGVAGARGKVGPSLDGFAERVYIAGSLPNRPGVLMDWVRRAPEMMPNTAMPPFPFSDREALDIAAFLYILR